MKARMRIVGIGAAVLVFGCVWTAEGVTVNVKPGRRRSERDRRRQEGRHAQGQARGLPGGRRVTKPLKIVGEAGDRPTISGGCDKPIVIDVQSKGVTLDNLKVKGARRPVGSRATPSTSSAANRNARNLRFSSRARARPAAVRINVAGRAIFRCWTTAPTGFGTPALHRQLGTRGRRCDRGHGDGTIAGSSSRSRTRRPDDRGSRQRVAQPATGLSRSGGTHHSADNGLYVKTRHDNGLRFDITASTTTSSKATRQERRDNQRRGRGGKGGACRRP